MDKPETLANQFIAKGQIKEAIKIYKEILTNSSGIKRAEILSMMGVAYFIGIRNRDSEYFNPAIECFDEALELCKPSDNNPLMAIILRNKGIALMHSGDFEQAKMLFEESYNMSKEYDSDKSQSAITLDKWGIALMNEKKFVEALEKMREALSLNTHWFYDGTINLDMARVYLSLGEYKEAEDFALKAEKIFLDNEEKEEHPRRLAEIYKILSITSKRLGSENHSKYESLFEENLSILDKDAQEVVKHQFI